MHGQNEFGNCLPTAPVSFHCAWKFLGIGLLKGTFLGFSLSSLVTPPNRSKSRPGMVSLASEISDVISTLSSGPIPGITEDDSSTARSECNHELPLFFSKFYLLPAISISSSPAILPGSVFKLYLSRIKSPGRFLVQNLLV